MAWEPPFKGLSEEEVEERYSREEFPSLDGLPAGDVIQRCWEEDFQAAADVGAALRRELRGLDNV